jgi:sugar (pentulose or hexulose) kinase
VALLACAADTGAALGDLAARWVQPAGVFVPDPARAAHYATQFARYRRLHPCLAPLAAVATPQR